MVTHMLFSASVAVFIAEATGLFSLRGIPLLLVASASSFLVNTTIDGFGHVKRGAYYVRTKFSHSISGATFFGLLSTAVLLAVIGLAPLFLHVEIEFLSRSFIRFSVETFVLALICGYTHLLADLPTEGGVYFQGRRVKLGGFSYNGPINIVFIITSMVLLYYSLSQSIPV